GGAPGAGTRQLGLGARIWGWALSSTRERRETSAFPRGSVGTRWGIPTLRRGNEIGKGFRARPLLEVGHGFIPGASGQGSQHAQVDVAGQETHRAIAEHGTSAV